MQRVWQAVRRHEFLVAIVVWLVAMIVLADPLKGAIGQLLAFGFLLLIESPFWLALLSPIGAIIGVAGAAVRLIFADVWRERAAKGS